jgi:cyanophycinase
MLATTAMSASPSTERENLLGLPERAVANRGSLVICGGGRTPNQVRDEFIRLAGGKKARIVLIPSAYPYRDMEHIRYRFSSWRELDVASFDILDTDSRRKADRAEFVRPLERATGVWIAGGMQSRLTYLYGGTRVETALRGVLERGGAIGGTSAGAACMSRVMILWGKSDATVGRGFGLLERAVVDQHFSQRRREPRLLGVLKDYPGTVGFGIDESTALVVRGNRLCVLGRSQVAVYLGPEAGRTYTLKDGAEADLVAGVSSKGGYVRVGLKVRR